MNLPAASRPDLLFCAVPASDSFHSHHRQVAPRPCRRAHGHTFIHHHERPAPPTASTWPVLSKLLDEMSSRKNVFPFMATSCAWIASKESDGRSRGAAIDPESLRNSAYAPRHPIDLAPQHISLTCSGTILGLPNGCRKRTWECVMCLETFPGPFPYTHPLLSACHGARGAPYWLFPDAAPDLVISKQAENVEFPTSPKSDLTRSPSLWVPWVTLRRG